MNQRTKGENLNWNISNIQQILKTCKIKRLKTSKNSIERIRGTSTNLLLFGLFNGIKLPSWLKRMVMRRDGPYLHTHSDVCRSSRQNEINERKKGDDVHDVIMQIFFANELIFGDFDQTQCHFLLFFLFSLTMRDFERENN